MAYYLEFFATVFFLKLNMILIYNPHPYIKSQLTLLERIIENLLQMCDNIQLNLQIVLFELFWILQD